MPQSTPNTVIQRGNNYYGAAAILNPFAQAAATGLAGVAVEGAKDLFGLHSASEDYQRSLIAANERALADKASASLKEEMLNPDFAEKWKDPAFQQQWASLNVGQDKAEAFLSGTVADSPLSRQVREAGGTLDDGGKNDPRPRLPGLAGAAATPGINPTAPLTSGAMDSLINAQGPEMSALTLTNAPAEAPTPTGVESQQGAKQEIQQGAQSAKSAPVGSTPEVPGVAPVAPPSPQQVAGTEPAQGGEQPQPFDRVKFEKDVSAYMLRQQGRVGLYRQVVTAATTGKMDAEQAAIGASLSGIHQRELTSLMETVASSMGVPLKDNDGKPIEGGSMLDGQAYAFMSKNPEGLKSLPAAKQEEVREAADRYRGLIGRLDSTKAVKLQDMVDKFTKSNLATPEAFLNYINAEKNRKQAEIEHKDNMGLKERAQTMDEKKLSMALEAQGIANEGQRIQLNITRKYAGPLAEAQLQKARVDVQSDIQTLQLKTTREERDNMTSLTSALNSKAEADARRGVVWYNDQQRKQTSYLKQISALNTTMATLEAKNAAILSPAYDNMKKLQAQMKDGSVIDKWISTLPPALQAQYRGAGPAEKLEQYYRTKDPQYASYASQMDELRRQVANQEKLFNASVDAPDPTITQDPLTASLQNYTQKLVDKQLAPLMKAEMKDLFKDSADWPSVLQENPTAVNIILGKTLSRRPEDKGWNSSDQPGAFNESKGLLIFAQGSIASGKQYDPQHFGDVMIQGKKLRDIIGPTRIGNYYNSYVQLFKELQP